MMKPRYYTILSLFVLLLPLLNVYAQDITGIPSCAYGCFVTAIGSSGCSLTDISCQCTTGKDAIRQLVTPCVAQTCSTGDASAVLPASQAICSKYVSSTSSASTASTNAGSTKYNPSVTRYLCLAGVLVTVVAGVAAV